MVQRGRLSYRTVEVKEYLEAFADYFLKQCQQEYCGFVEVKGDASSFSGETDISSFFTELELSKEISSFERALASCRKDADKMRKVLMQQRAEWERCWVVLCRFGEREPNQNEVHTRLEELRADHNKEMFLGLLGGASVYSMFMWRAERSFTLSMARNTLKPKELKEYAQSLSKHGVRSFEESDLPGRKHTEIHTYTLKRNGL